MKRESTIPGMHFVHCALPEKPGYPGHLQLLA